MTEGELLVYLDLEGEPVRAGTLFMRVLRDRESASFVYDEQWLSHRQRFPLDPVQLPLSRDPFHTAGGQRLFGGLGDSAPDRWGRNLIARQARAEGVRRTLFESDFLVRVHDTVRAGALRFKEHERGPFLANDGKPIPPLVRLGDLLAASDAIQHGESDVEALRLLLAPGSSLGGARPKASVLDVDGRLSIAKFPAVTDDWPVVAWEAVTLRLAASAGIRVPEARLAEVGGRSVLLVARFDREGPRRVPFLSAMAMIGATDGDEGHSYLELADAIRRYGKRIDENLTELWRRMVFNVLVSNTDDHLRNHGFCRGRDGWTLSPAYDLNPVPVDVKPRVHALALDDSSPDASLERVTGVAAYFGLQERDARRIVGEIGASVSRWRESARAMGLRETDLDRMASAFEHDDLREATQMMA